MSMNLGLDRVIWTAIAAHKDNGGFATREEIQSYYAGRRNQGATTVKNKANLDVVYDILDPSGPTAGEFAPPLETALMVFRRVKLNEAVIANMELVIAQGLRDSQPTSVDAIMESMRGLGVELPQRLDWLFNYGGR
jgi:hypothetical protein